MSEPIPFPPGLKQGPATSLRFQIGNQTIELTVSAKQIEPREPTQVIPIVQNQPPK